MTTRAWLALRGITFQCVIGVGDEERRRPQTITVDLDVRIDVDKAAASDSIQDTVDYRTLSRRLIAAGEATRFRLIEALAGHLRDVVAEEFPGVLGLSLTLEKEHRLAAARSVRAVVVWDRDPLAP
jgi:dihydroneopterin aldolase